MVVAGRGQKLCLYCGIPAFARVINAYLLMRRFFDQALFFQIGAEHREGFLREINLENTKKAHVVSCLGLFFLPVLLLLDWVRHTQGTLWSDPVHTWLFFSHLSFALFAIPFCLYRTHRVGIHMGTFTGGRRLARLTLYLMTLTLLPMTVLGLLDRGTMILYAVYVLISNLFLNLSHRDRIAINVYAFLGILTAILLLPETDFALRLARVLECLSLQVPTFVFATFQHNLRARQFAGERMLEEQKNLIEWERQRADSLLQNILPASVAAELMEHGFVQPRHFGQVTVLFADFKGFSKICAALSPEQLIADLNYCFGQFDRIVTRLGLDRVKTMGDCYMCVAGIPEPRPDHAVRMVQAAFAMQHFLEKWRLERIQQGLPVFEARIGMHSGSVVGGIVGTTKFAFDIWGDTVNIAARMESNGKPNRVNISGATYALVRDYYNCEYRGNIPIKNIGEAEMYFVVGAKVEFSAAAKPSSLPTPTPPPTPIPSPAATTAPATARVRHSR